MHGGEVTLLIDVQVVCSMWLRTQIDRSCCMIYACMSMTEGCMVERSSVVVGLGYLRQTVGV